MTAPDDQTRPADQPPSPLPGGPEAPDEPVAEGVRETAQTIRAISRLEESN
jgi:hypothetical protein